MPSSTCMYVYLSAKRYCIQVELSCKSCCRLNVWWRYCSTLLCFFYSAVGGVSHRNVPHFSQNRGSCCTSPCSPSLYRLIEMSTWIRGHNFKRKQKPSELESSNKMPWPIRVTGAGFKYVIVAFPFDYIHKKVEKTSRNSIWFLQTLRIWLKQHPHHLHVNNACCTGWPSPSLGSTQRSKFIPLSSSNCQRAVNIEACAPACQRGPAPRSTMLNTFLRGGGLYTVNKSGPKFVYRVL